MENQKCYYCGGETFETRYIKYIYSREGHDLYVPAMPADVCLTCGTVYYHGPALLRVEERFKAIYEDDEEPDRYATMPVLEHV